jgi:aspartyl-tRNA(Asn)/glutamyl-tRNA(Gln) amidotransferase subunit B
MSDWETVIGLEVHAQLSTATKIFSACPHGGAQGPNQNVDPVSLGLPGTLPVLNRDVVRGAVMMGLATGSTIAPVCRFARKHYFYPDLPKGYQISQFDEPICEHGFVNIPLAGGGEKRIGITRIHMEDDAGKTVHDPQRGVSRVDYNRAGVPLIEIVSEPELSHPDEVVAYLKILHRIVRFLGISDGNMEVGNFRCDANISLRPVGSEVLGTRAELKNMNSFRNVHRALIHEVERQRRVLEGGGEVVQETRLWDDVAARTETMRSKEDAHDYRYFNDPDLLPIHLDEDWIRELKASLPELPAEREARYRDTLGLGAYDAGVLTGSPELADYYDAVIGVPGTDPKKAANWVSTELLGQLAREDKDIGESPVSPAQLARILALMEEGTISSKMAKEVFDRVFREGIEPDAVVAEVGGQITDSDQLLKIVREVIGENPSQADQYREGKTQVLGFFVGRVMAATRGKANPPLVNELLKKELDA